MRPLRIDRRRNAADLPDGGRLVWQRRWASDFLALLVQQARHDLSVDLGMLETCLVRRGHTAVFSAVTVLRLLDTLETFLGALPGQPLRIEYPPRKASRGPWRLRWLQALTVLIDDEPEPGTPAAADLGEDHFIALIDGPPGRIDALHGLLSHLISSDAFHAIGDQSSALELLQACAPMPLSTDARALIGLRMSLCLKRLGRFDEARLALRDISVLPELHDRSARASVQFLYDRIDYDADPGGQHHRLWSACTPPPRIQQPDRHLLAQWHNLRALLCRRRLESQGRLDPPVHRLALRHLETAMHHALMQRDGEGLLAYIANLALHLTSVLPLGACDVRQVMAWHELALVCTDKLGVGGGDAWETIYLAQFWLDHEDELQALPEQPGQSVWMPVIGNLHPRDTAFHVAMVERVQATGDARQRALAWLCCWRHACRHRPTHEELPVRLSLIKALQAEPDLAGRLRREGYGPWLDRLAERHRSTL